MLLSVSVREGNNIDIHNSESLFKQKSEEQFS